jgi:uncharacterized membrane protein
MRPEPAESTEGTIDIAAISRQLRRLTWLVVIGVTASVVAIVTYAVHFRGPLSNSVAEWGQFGDYVGGLLNPIFGFLGLVALLATLYLQRQQLQGSLQELKDSAKSLRAQEREWRIQNFEASFFELLRLHNDIVNTMDLEGKPGTKRDGLVTRGRDCISVFLDRYRSSLLQHGANDDFGEAMRLYEKFFEKHEKELGHYFRLLYNIVKFVDRSTGIGGIEDKRFYTNLVRAQLSSDELSLLFFNGLSKRGAPKFKPLMETYALLKTLPAGDFPSRELRKYYNPKAFGITS